MSLSRRDIIGGLYLLAVVVAVTAGALLVTTALTSMSDYRLWLGGTGAALLSGGLWFSGLADSAEDRADPNHWWNRYLR